MRTHNIIIGIIALLSNGLVYPQSLTNKKWKVIEKFSMKWDDTNGIPYTKKPGANLGVTSFVKIDETNFAFLSNATKEVLIFEGSIVKLRIPLYDAPRDFIYDDNEYHVLFENSIAVYNTIGQLIKKDEIPSNYRGVERLMRNDRTTYLLLPNGNSLRYSTNVGLKPIFEELKGWISSSGDLIYILPFQEKSFYIKLNDKEIIGPIYTKRKIAGVFPIGSNEKNIYIDVQEYESENPVIIKRMIVSVPKNRDVINNIDIPSCYYTLINTDFIIDKEGGLLNMISAPDKLYIFSLEEINNNENDLLYPEYINNCDYHFNNHLLNVKY